MTSLEINFNSFYVLLNLNSRKCNLYFYSRCPTLQKCRTLITSAYFNLYHVISALLSLIFENMADEKIILDNIIVEQNKIESSFLERNVQIDAYLPTNILRPENVSLLLINDGQDLPKMPFEEILDTFIAQNIVEPLICIGIHCGPERKWNMAQLLKKIIKGGEQKHHNTLSLSLKNCFRLFIKHILYNLLKKNLLQVFRWVV